MAYIDAELNSFRILWQSVCDRVLTFVLVATGMCFASWLVLSLGYPQVETPLLPLLNSY